MSWQPLEVVNPDARGPFLIICDHASNFVPPQLNNLGLTQADLARHIAWDIGAAGVARLLSARFDSPAVLSSTSRLVVDCNRHPDADGLIPAVSDGTIVPRNNPVTAADREARLRDYFRPYHEKVEEMLGKLTQPIFLSVHSMTDCLHGTYRPWSIALSSFEDRSLVNPLLNALRSAANFQVGDNEPYDLDPRVDYSTPRHALRRGLRHLQVEFRQDLIGTPEGQQEWAGRFGDAIERAGILRTRPQ